MDKNIFLTLNSFLILTLVLVAVHSIHTMHAIDDVLSAPGTCRSYAYEEFLMGTASILSAILVFFSFLAYLRDGRRFLLLGAIGYLALLVNCLLWLQEDFLSSFAFLSIIKIATFILATVLLAYSFFIMSKR